MSEDDKLKIVDKLIRILKVLKNPIQIAGLCIALAVVLITKIWVPGALATQVAAIVLGVVFLLFGQIFAHLEAIPSNHRAWFLIIVLVTMCVIAPIAPILLVLRFNETPKPSPAQHSAAEEQILGFTNELGSLRGEYDAILESPSKALVVNTTSHQLVQKLLAVNDADLSLGFQLLKYEHVAYAWAMVAGSESDSKSRLQAAESVLNACTRSRELVTEANRPGPFDKKLQQIREWIIKDDADARIERLTAVALCTRWQIDHREQDRQRVREIIENLPNHYLVRERPDRSYELQPCLNGRIQNSLQK